MTVKRWKPASSWRVFLKKNMSKAMRQYGSHTAAMRALGVAWRKRDAAASKTKKKAKKKKGWWG